MGEHSRVVKSTADLSPDGILGYAKALSAFAEFLGAALAVVVPFVQPDSVWAVWLGGAIAVLGFLGTYAFPNRVQPVLVTTSPTSGLDVP